MIIDFKKALKTDEEVFTKFKLSLISYLMEYYSNSYAEASTLALEIIEDLTRNEKGNKSAPKSKFNFATDCE